MKDDRVIVISGPSGSGKTTILKRILPLFPQLCFSVSVTTRTKRPHEKDGIDYYFVSQKEFRKRISNKEFIEYEEVYTDIFYGTLWSEIKRLNKNQFCPILDIDVAGAVSIKNIYGKNSFMIFIDPGSHDILRQRLIHRNTEDEKSINMRISKAEKEIALAKHFDCIVLNDDLEKAVEETAKLISEFLNR